MVALERVMQQTGLGADGLLLKCYTAEEAAPILGIPLGTLRNMTYRREIPVVKNGRSVRYRLLDLLAWIEDRSVPALQ